MEWEKSNWKTIHKFVFFSPQIRQGSTIFCGDPNSNFCPGNTSCPTVWQPMGSDGCVGNKGSTACLNLPWSGAPSGYFFAENCMTFPTQWNVGNKVPESVPELRGDLYPETETLCCLRFPSSRRKKQSQKSLQLETRFQACTARFQFWSKGNCKNSWPSFQLHLCGHKFCFSSCFLSAREIRRECCFFNYTFTPNQWFFWEGEWLEMMWTCVITLRRSWLQLYWRIDDRKLQKYFGRICTKFLHQYLKPQQKISTYLHNLWNTIPRLKSEI